MVNSTAWEGAVETVKYAVYLGVWTNWSRGRILGSTLTLSREDGNYLLSFTAFFIGLVSTRFWRIICFILHNSFSTSRPRDALYHQQQAILRNSDSADAGLVVLLQLAWAWRKIAKRAFVRVLPVIVTAALSAAAFTVAGGFSSSISTGVGNDVLLDGSNCAIVNTSNSNGVASMSLIQPYVSRQCSTAVNYAQQCYSANTSGMFDCGTFVKPRIPSSVDNQTACPFADGICQSGTNLHFDTGYIDSHEHLGVNAPPNERISFRLALQCAPLVTEGYSNDSSTSTNNYTTYYYGESPSGEYTYRTTSRDTQYRQAEGNQFKLLTSVSVVLNGTTWRPESDFEPAPGLFPGDGDLILAFLLGNGVLFMERTDDPWYRGTVRGRQNITWEDESKPSYWPEEAASPMACLQQYQFCNPALPEGSRCGPLAGILDAQLQAAPLFGMTEEQITNNEIPDTPAGSRYVWFLQYLTMAVPVLSAQLNMLGPNSLASQQSLSREWGTIGAIPNHQWQLDVENWWATYMASLQAGMVDIAYGPQDPALEPYRVEPFNAHIQKMCNNQRILSSDYTSFSVFGLCFIYVLGILIVGISYLLEHIQAWLYNHRNLKEYAYLEWTANETLQLQRMAYQGVGSGRWSRYADRIPITEAGDMLADLPRSYPLDKKNEADVEQGHPADKKTGTIVTTVQAGPPSRDNTDSSTLISCDDDFHLDQAGVGGRRSVVAVSPEHGLSDKSIGSPYLPHTHTNIRPPTDAAARTVEQPTPTGPKDPGTATPERVRAGNLKYIDSHRGFDSSCEHNEGV